MIIVAGKAILNLNEPLKIISKPRSMDIDNAFSLITEKLNVWAKEIIAMTPNLILAALILAIAFLVAKLARKIAYKVIKKISHKEVLNNLFAVFVYILIVGIGLFTALTVLQLDKAVTSILAGAGIIGLALGFAFQDIAGNFISGIFISFRRPFNMGDLTESQDYRGRVKKVNLRDSVIVTVEGNTVILPNKNLFQNPIRNFDCSGRRRMDCKCRGFLWRQSGKSKRIVMEAVDSIPLKSPKDETTFFYREFGIAQLILMCGYG